MSLAKGLFAGGVIGALGATGALTLAVQERRKAELIKRIEPKPSTYPEHLRTAIIVATPDLELDRFRKCYRHLSNYTTGQHQIIVVNTRFKEKLYDHPRDMNLVMAYAPDVDYYVLMNDDIYVEEGWLDALIHTALKDPKIGIVGGLFLYPDGVRIQHAGGFWNPTLARVNIQLSVGHLCYQKMLYECPEALKEKYVIFVTGALTLVTKECIHALQGWDKNLKTNWNDVDFSFRAWENGFRVAYTPKCRAIHDEGLTLRFTKRVTTASKQAMPTVKKRWSIERVMKIQEMVREANESGKLGED